MFKRNKDWYVISGCPASGKTTVIKQLKKMGFTAYTQIAEDIIKQRIKNGEKLKDIRDNKWLLQYQIIYEQCLLESNLKKDLVFLDTGLIDNLTFSLYYGIKFPKIFKPYLKKLKYKKVFILEPLENENNGIRIETDKQRFMIQNMTRFMYDLYDVPIVEVPVMSVKDRVSFILSNIK